VPFGEPIRHKSIQPQDDEGRRDNGEEEGDLCSENRPENFGITEGRKPQPINQNLCRASQRDQAS